MSDDQLRIVAVVFETYFFWFVFTLAAGALQLPDVVNSVFVSAGTIAALSSRYLDVVQSEPAVFSLSTPAALCDDYRPAQRLGFYFAFQLGEFALLCLYQHVAGSWFLSLSNLGVAAWSDWSSLLGAVQWNQVASFVVAGPLLEEFVFRGLVLRLALSSTATPDRASVVSGLAFGLFHLPNALSGLVHPVYLLFQIAMATGVGVFFALHTVLAGRSLRHACLLHMSNNLTSMFLPLDLSPAHWPAVLWLCVLFNALVLLAVIYDAHRILHNKNKSQ